MDPLLIQSLMYQYEMDPRQFTDRQAEQIALLARKYGFNFSRESKPIRKFAFDLADTALLGLIPNTLRPTTRGESVFGETKADRFAGTAGSIGGLATAGLAGLANLPRIIGGAGAATRSARGFASNVRQGTGRVGDFAESAGDFYRTARNTFTSSERGPANFGPSFFDALRNRFRTGANRDLLQLTAGV
jgi:hypothetical protein